ncbi:MAG: hypothetical protein ABWW69_05140 [Pyrodictiaceae archaeon]
MRKGSFIQSRQGFVVPAWLVGLSVGGEHREYCVDSFFPLYASEAYRRILFVYPASVCISVPPSEAIMVGDHIDAGRLLSLIAEGCREASRLAGTVRPSLLRIALLMPPSKEEKKSIEARIARELCSTVFGEEKEPEWLIEEYIARKSLIHYMVGDKRNKPWQRLEKLSRIDPGLAVKLIEILK